MSYKIEIKLNKINIGRLFFTAVVTLSEKCDFSIKRTMVRVPGTVSTFNFSFKLRSFVKVNTY